MRIKHVFMGQDVIFDTDDPIHAEVLETIFDTGLSEIDALGNQYLAQSILVASLEQHGQIPPQSVAFVMGCVLMDGGTKYRNNGRLPLLGVSERQLRYWAMVERQREAGHPVYGTQGRENKDHAGAIERVAARVAEIDKEKGKKERKDDSAVRKAYEAVNKLRPDYDHILDRLRDGLGEYDPDAIGLMTTTVVWQNIDDPDDIIALPEGQDPDAPDDMDSPK